MTEEEKKRLYELYKRERARRKKKREAEITDYEIDAKRRMQKRNGKKR